jgi:hypothetical protein
MTQGPDAYNDRGDQADDKQRNKLKVEWGIRMIDNARGDTCLDNSLCDQLQPISISLVVSFVYREVETKASVDLNVNKAWTVQSNI